MGLIGFGATPGTPLDRLVEAEEVPGVVFAFLVVTAPGAVLFLVWANGFSGKDAEGFCATLSGL